MRELIYISGGQRSGKSRYAQKLACAMSEEPIYLATARVWDDDFRRRIERHQADRGEHWRSIEIDRSISDIHRYLAQPSMRGNNESPVDSRLPKTIEDGGEVVLVDCITLWVTNFFTDADGDIERAFQEITAEWERFNSLNIRTIAVSNEIGMGVIPDNEIARKFADLQGFVNQHIAGQANRQILMLSGSAVTVKGESG